MRFPVCSRDLIVSKQASKQGVSDLEPPHPIP